MELEIMRRVDLPKSEHTLAATESEQKLTKLWQQVQPIFEKFLTILEAETGYKIKIGEPYFMGVEWEARVENCYEATLAVELTAPDYINERGYYSVYEVWDKDFDRKFGLSINV